MSLDTGALNALYKVAYPKSVIDLIPVTQKISDMFDFVPSDLQNGKHYEQPVVLTGEAGFTYSLDTQNAYDLNDSIGMNMASAIVPGADIVLDSSVGYNQAARASHNATSFKSVMSMKFENMIKSSRKRLEIAMLYGGTNIGQAAQQDVGTPTTELTMVLTTSQWATGIWTGMERAQLCFTRTSNNNAVDSLRSFTLKSVNVDARSITVEAGLFGTAGSISALEAAIEAYGINIHFFGTVTGSGVSLAYTEMYGLKIQLTNVGTLYGIDASIYDLWRGNSVTISGQATMAKILSALSRPVQRGLESDVVAFCHPFTWADLASNLAALRRFDGSYSKKKSTNGSQNLEYISQNGAIELVSYNIVKEGDMIIVPKDKVIRIGARELSLNDPTREADEIFFTIPGKAGVGLRAYTNQSIFLNSPAQGVYISGIQNSTP